MTTINQLYSRLINAMGVEGLGNSYDSCQVL